MQRCLRSHSMSSEFCYRNFVCSQGIVAEEEQGEGRIVDIVLLGCTQSPQAVIY